MVKMHIWEKISKSESFWWVKQVHCFGQYLIQMKIECGVCLMMIRKNLQSSNYIIYKMGLKESAGFPILDIDLVI